MGGSARATRREVLCTGALLGASAVAAPWIVSSRARAQNAELDA
jgi:hypothetical protein